MDFLGCIFIDFVVFSIFFLKIIVCFNIVINSFYSLINLFFYRILGEIE